MTRVIIGPIRPRLRPDLAGRPSRRILVRPGSAAISRIVVGLLVALPALVVQAPGELAFQAKPFRLYSAFWPNLHHLLWAEAWTRRPPTPVPPPSLSLPEPLAADLTASERAAWDAAVKYYDDELADLHPLFELGPVRKVMIAAGVTLPATGLEADHRRTLAAAADVYRRHWWPAHDHANRAWVADPMSKLASISPGVPDRLARLYGTPWFTAPVRVDLVRVGAREGAYTSVDPAPAHITVSTGSPILTGWTAVEVLLHEASHALAHPLMEAFAAESRAQNKNTRDLWHVALFFLTGEVVRQALAARQIDYQPYLYSTGLFDRAWPQFKAPIETHWKAYIDGAVPRDDAIRQIVAVVK